MDEFRSWSTEDEGGVSTSVWKFQIENGLLYSQFLLLSNWKPKLVSHWKYLRKSTLENILRPSFWRS